MLENITPVQYALAAAVVAVVSLSRIGKRERFLPPGPPTIPVLGNAHSIPQFPWQKLTEWARRYGGIFSLKIGSGTVIVLTKLEPVHEILDKQQAVTADRAPNHFLEVVTDGLNMTMARYGPKWRSMRRAAHEILTQKAAYHHRPIQDGECAQMLYEVLTSPKNWYNSARRVSCSIILSVTYGKRTPCITSPEFVTFFDTQHRWEYLLMPGSYAPVDFIPIMKNFPEPLAKWKEMCRTVKSMQRGLYFPLLEEVEKRVASDDPGNGCYIETVVSKAKEWGLDREMIAYLGGALIEAGSDTSASFTQSLILCLINNPEVQEKAHEELDRVVGNDRCPVHEDLENLPYINAIVYEVLRMRPNTPIIPHAATADVPYGDYVVPAGSTIFANLWGMYHDPDVYEEPDKFNPDRFLKSQYGTKPEYEGQAGRRNTFSFGFGRRACPGIHVATYTIQTSTLNLLWSFNFEAPKNDKGETYYPDINAYAQALSSFPPEFDCIITPRSEHHAQLIREKFVEFFPLYENYEKTISEDDKKFVKELRTKEKAFLTKSRK